MNMRTKKMAEWTNWTCSKCGKRLNKWDERCSNALKTRMTCESCLAEQYGKSIKEFNDYLDEWFQIRTCQGVKR